MLYVFKTARVIRWFCTCLKLWVKYLSLSFVARNNESSSSDGSVILFILYFVEYLKKAAAFLV